MPLYTEHVQVWGLDFGDCHRSLFAHQDAVMTVAFVPGMLHNWGQAFTARCLCSRKCVVATAHRVIAMPHARA